MYAQVVVLTYQPPEIDSYTYEIPKDLEGKIKPGQLVSVPFGKRNPLGLILNTKYQIPDTNLSIKPITSIILDQPLLLNYQIDLLQWMSSYYLAPMGNCLDAMLPDIPKKISDLQIASSKTSQTLVLVPNIDRIPETLAGFPQAKNYVIYHSELAMVPKFVMWQKILSGNTDFIFGSRLAVFTPCPNLKKIIIYDEHDGAYKDERSPYFDTLTVAEKIADLAGAKIEIIDSSPRVTTFANHPDVQVPKLNVPTKTIDMAIEKAYGSFSPISQTLEEILNRAADKKLSTLLFLNKKSESGSVYCKSCKINSPVPKQVDICPNCTSADIYFNSVNTKSLAAQVKKILPGAAIDIETAAAFYKLQPQKYDVAVHIKTDSVLNLPDFASSEKLYEQITNLKKLATRMVILQTYNPDHPAIKSAIGGNYQQFYKEELEQRKTFSYPPFALLIKLTLSGKNSEEKSQKLASVILDLIENQDPRIREDDGKNDATVLGPFPLANRQNIILKLPLPNYSLLTRTKTLEKLKSLLPHQKDIRIIVEPDSLVSF